MDDIIAVTLAWKIIIKIPKKFPFKESGRPDSRICYQKIAFLVVPIEFHNPAVICYVRE